MGLLDKVKNLFTEEVEVEVTEPERKEKKHKEKKQEEEIQKEVIQVEIPSPAETYEPEEEIEIKEEIKKEDYKFPFFDDEDFDMIDLEKEKVEEKTNNYRSVYNPPKEEKKAFKPSPIISPVYGFLDKDYQKDELVKKTNDYNPRKATVDEIRDKAYGSLESDIETTLFGNNRVLFDEKSKIDETEKIKEEKAIDEIRDEYNSRTIEEKPRHQKMKDDEDLTELLEEEMTKPEKQEKKKPRKISDKELFNLIDSMYEGEIKWW